MHVIFVSLNKFIKTLIILLIPLFIYRLVSNLDLIRNLYSLIFIKYYFHAVIFVYILAIYTVFKFLIRIYFIKEFAKTKQKPELPRYLPRIIKNEVFNLNKVIY